MYILKNLYAKWYKVIDKSENIRESKELNKINQQVYEEEREQRAAQKLKEVGDSFYQKLTDGFKINILVVGDSIGAGDGAQTVGKELYTLLQSYLQKTYWDRVYVTNASMGRNTSYAG